MIKFCLRLLCNTWFYRDSNWNLKNIENSFADKLKYKKTTRIRMNTKTRTIWFNLHVTSIWSFIYIVTRIFCVVFVWFFFCPIHRCLASLIFLSAICSTQFFLFFFFRFEFTTVQNKNYANSTHCDISVAGFWILIVVGVGVVQQQQRLL